MADGYRRDEAVMAASSRAEPPQKAETLTQSCERTVKLGAVLNELVARFGHVEAKLVADIGGVEPSVNIGAEKSAPAGLGLPGLITIVETSSAKLSRIAARLESLL